MHSSLLKGVRIATGLFLLAVLVSVLPGHGWAASTGFAGGIPWQVGDVIICFGTTADPVGGTCNIVRIVGGSPVLLDQFSDRLLGDTRGIAIDNTLHAVVTDNGSGPISDSNVVVYTIASLNPDTTPASVIAHTILPNTPFSASGGPGSGNAQAVVVNKIGHIFVGNAGTGDPTPNIVELNPDGTLASPSVMPQNPLFLTNANSCTLDTADHLLSMDLSHDGSTLYLTSNVGSFSTSTSNGGNILQLTLSTGMCTKFASFGPGVALYGIQVGPPHMLDAVSPSCHGTPCPTDETILVVAEGFLDSDGGDEPLEPPSIPDQTNDTNICTNKVNSPLVSCVLLLDTGGPGLAPSQGQWVPDNAYALNNTILDPFLHDQKVTTAGTSGINVSDTTYPVWNEGGSTTEGLQWTRVGPGLSGTYPDWAPNTTYCAPAAHSCPAGSVAPFFQVSCDCAQANDIWQATTFGTSGGSKPTFYDDVGTPISPVFDNAVTWQDQGTSLVTTYPVTGVSTLQPLALGALVTDCTAPGSCTTLNPPTAPRVSNFLVGDNGSANVYNVDLATGTLTTYSANANTPGGPCGTCTSATRIQGVRVYGGQGANQADLTKLASGSLTSATNFSSIVQFPLPAQSPPNQADTNALTVTLAGTGLSHDSSVPFALYASLASKAAPTNDGGNNSGRTDVNARDINGHVLSPPPPCQPTTSDFTKCIVWKIDIIGTGLGPPANTAVFTKFDGPANPVTPPAGVTAGIDNGTHVFLDEHYDVTTFTGQFDPGGGTCQPICRSFSSVWSLQEIATAFTSGSGGSSGCFYVIAGTTVLPGGTYHFNSHRSTLPIEFQCPGVPFATFSTTMNNPPGPPELDILRSGSVTGGVKSAPVAINLTATNTKAPYRFNGTDYIFNWTPIAGTFDVCTFDPTNTIQSFCATLTSP